MNEQGRSEKNRASLTDAVQGDEKNRPPRKAKVTALDFLILILLVLCVVGIIFRNVIASFFIESVPTEKVTISFMCDGLTENEVALVKEGDAMMLDGEIFGEIAAVSVSNAVDVVTSEDDEGNPVFTEVTDPETFVVKGSISVSGRYNNDGFSSEQGVQLHVGKILNIYSSSYNLTVIITEIPQN